MRKSIVAALGAGLLACAPGSGGGNASGTSGGSSTTTSAGTNTGGTTGGGSTSGASGGASGGTTSAGSTSGGSSGGASYFGSVEFTATSMPQATYYNALAGFSATAPNACLGGVPTGDCCYFPPDADAGLPPQVSAGAITLTDDGNTIGTLTFDGGYAPLSSMTNARGLSWKPGHSLSANASGSIVGPFTQSLVAPAPPTVTSPALQNLGTTSIPAGQPLTVSWTPGAAGDVVTASLNGARNGASDGDVVCRASDAAGTLTVPASLMANFHPGDVGAIVVGRTTQKTAPCANATVTIGATIPVSGVVTYR